MAGHQTLSTVFFSFHSRSYFFERDVWYIPMYQLLMRFTNSLCNRAAYYLRYSDDIQVDRTIDPLLVCTTIKGDEELS